MDTNAPDSGTTKDSRLQRLVDLARDFAATETYYHKTQGDTWNNIHALIAELDDDVPELLEAFDKVSAEFAANFSGVVAAGVAAGVAAAARADDGCGHDHAQDAPAEPQTAADAVELGARQTADELLGAGFSERLNNDLEAARHQLLDPPDDSAKPTAVRVPTLRMPVIGTPQDRVLAALRTAWADGDNGAGGLADLVTVQAMTGLNPATAAKALGALVKAGKAVKVGENTYGLAG